MVLDLYYRKSYSSNGYKNVSKMMILSPTPIVVGDEITKTSEFDEYDFVSYANQFKSSDFSLSNLMAIGATDLLQPVQLSVNSNMAIADSFQDSMLTLKQNTDVS